MCLTGCVLFLINLVTSSWCEVSHLTQVHECHPPAVPIYDSLGDTAVEYIVGHAGGCSLWGPEV